jgi:nucleotide-binding universal stress UspA family protein
MRCSVLSSSRSNGRLNMSIRNDDDPRALLGEVPRLDKVLVPLDGTPHSERVFGLVRAILSRQETELVLLAVLPRDEAWVKCQDDSVELTCDYLDWRRQLLAKHLGRVRYAIRVGDPAEEIARFAEEFEPSLIAMSTHGRSGLERLRWGSVTEGVLRRSRFPVLAVSPTGRDALEKPRVIQVHNILVALDGSVRSGGILPTVIGLARLCNSVVTLVHVNETPRAHLGAETWDPATPPVADGALESWRAAVAASGVSVRAITVSGSPVSSILAAASDHASDLVALTTHGRSGLPRLVLGSVAEQVLRRCPCPVLVQRTVEAAPVRSGEIGSLWRRRGIS